MNKKLDNLSAPGYRIGTVEGINKIRRQESRLKRRDLQNAIFNSANFSSIATDANGVIQIFNVGAERMLGYAAAHVINRITPTDISDPQEVTARAQVLSAELGIPISSGFEALVFKASRGTEDTYELTYIRKDGSRFPAVVSVTALRDDQAAIIGYLFIGTDNTPHKRMVEDRKRFFELSQDVLCILGFDGYFKDVNPAWEKTLGYTKSELLTTPFIEFVHPDDRQVTLAEAEKVAGGKALIAFENRYCCKDGSYRWFQWGVTPVIKDGVMYGVAHDVTKGKRTEQALRESERYFRFINELIEATRMLINPAQIMAVMARMLGEHLCASRCAYADVEKDGEQFTILHDYTDGCASTMGSYQLSFFGARAVATLSSGQTLVIRNVEAELLPGDGVKMFNAIGIQAIITCPLVKDESLCAMMAVHQTTPREWTPGEIALVQDVVERCWATIERRNAEEKVARKRARMRRLVDSNAQGVLFWNTKGAILEANDEFLRIVGYTREDLEAGRLAWAAMTPPEYAHLDRHSLEEMAATGVCTPFEKEYIRKDGSRVSVLLGAAIFEDRSDEGVCFVLDMTARKEAEAAVEAAKVQLDHLAHHDVLTGLPNRILFQDRLNEAIELACRQCRHVALLFVDLDQFKHINDSLGHAVGDKLLQSVVQRLVSCVRNSDTISRQGGDEFVLLLPYIKHQEDAAICAQKILAAFALPHYIDQHELYISGSIGISIYPDDGKDGETLIKSADIAMYFAKDNGRNNYKFFKQDMNDRAVQRQSIEASLRRALERQEFVLHYQPKINLKSGAIVGVEALIRWQHPERGLIPPGQFVPIAEDCGLILQLGRWVLREACRQAQSWQQAGLPPIIVAVNTSALEFRTKDFLDNIGGVLKETCLEPRYLELELTESVLMQDAGSTDSILHTLADLGVKLAIDDFGTGYSSLSYLRQFPIDTLKIDQSFVKKMCNNLDDAAIVSAVISMGKSLKKRIIAEGIETREQYEFLLAQECDEGQGYYFSRPVAANEFTTLLQTGISPITN